MLFKITNMIDLNWLNEDTPIKINFKGHILLEILKETIPYFHFRCR